MVKTIDFEQELYKQFGQVKDFTLGMRIAKYFYEMGRNYQESQHGKELLYVCNKTAEKTKREVIEKTLSWLEYYVDAEERKNYKEYMEE